MQGLSRLGVEPSPEEIQLLFKKYDDDGVGNVNYVAFSRTVDALEQVSLAHRHRLRTPTLSLEPSRNPNPCPYPCPCPCCSSPTGARRRPYISPISPIALPYISPISPQFSDRSKEAAVKRNTLYGGWKKPKVPLDYLASFK